MANTFSYGDLEDYDNNKNTSKVLNLYNLKD